MTAHEAMPAGPADDRSPTAYPTLVACFLGYMLNGTDLWILDVAMREGMPFVKTRADVVLIDTATLLTSAGGGWLAGWLSDRFGRVLTLQGMIALFAVPTFLCGFAQDYASLFFWRAIMGIGFGGQWAAAAVLVGEAFGKADRGEKVGYMQFGWALGWGFALFGLPPLAHLINFQWWPDVPVWQLLFRLGLAPVFLMFYVGIFVRESPLTAGIRKKSPATDAKKTPAADGKETSTAGGKKIDALEIFSAERLWTTFWACVLSIGAMSGYWAILFWLPVFLKESGFEQDNWYRAFLIVGSGVGYLSSAWFIDVGRFGLRGDIGVCAIVAVGLLLLWFMDKTGTSYLAYLVFLSGGAYFLGLLRGNGDPHGRRRNFVIFAIFTIVAVFACVYFAAHKGIILALALPLGFFASGIFSGIGAWFTELFPTRMRGSGVGFTYNFGRGVAVLILGLIPWYAEGLQ